MRRFGVLALHMVTHLPVTCMHTREFVFSPKQRHECQKRLKSAAVIAVEGVKSQTAARKSRCCAEVFSPTGKGPPKGNIKHCHWGYADRRRPPNFAAE